MLPQRQLLHHRRHLRLFVAGFAAGFAAGFVVLILPRRQPVAFAQFGDERRQPFAQEMWALFERGELLPDTKLKGLYRPDTKAADMGGLLRELEHAKRDAVRAGLAVADDEPGAREDDRAPRR